MVDVAATTLRPVTWIVSGAGQHHTEPSGQVTPAGQYLVSLATTISGRSSTTRVQEDTPLPDMGERTPDAFEHTFPERLWIYVSLSRKIDQKKIPTSCEESGRMGAQFENTN
jgi:hypothetical protein